MLTIRSSIALFRQFIQRNDSQEFPHLTILNEKEKLLFKNLAKALPRTLSHSIRFISALSFLVFTVSFMDAVSKGQLLRLQNEIKLSGNSNSGMENGNDSNFCTKMETNMNENIQIGFFKYHILYGWHTKSNHNFQ